MRYRKLAEDGDMMFGHGDSDYHIDSVEMVVQAVVTRLRLLYGEWFMDITDGTPWETSILGKHTQEEYDYAIQERILNTQGVSSLKDYASVVDRDTRSLTVSFTVNTIYGEAAGSDTYVYNSLY